MCLYSLFLLLLNRFIPLRFDDMGKMNLFLLHLFRFGVWFSVCSIVEGGHGPLRCVLCSCLVSVEVIWCLAPFYPWEWDTKVPNLPCGPVCLYRSSCLLFFCLFGTVLAKMQDPLCLFRLVLAWNWLSGRPSAPASPTLPRSSIPLCVPSFSGYVLASEVWILQIAEI